MALDFNVTTLTPDEMLAEVQRCVEILIDNDIDVCIMTEREAEFVISMQGATKCTPAQLNWLRRLVEKYT